MISLVYAREIKFRKFRILWRIYKLLQTTVRLDRQWFEAVDMCSKCFVVRRFVFTRLFPRCAVEFLYNYNNLNVCFYLYNIYISYAVLKKLLFSFQIYR